MSSPVTRVLAAEHEQVLVLLATCRAARGGVDLTRFDAFRHRLLRHLAIEEKLLMPALVKALGKPPVFQNALRKDHAGLVALCVPTPAPEWLDDLADQLDHHQRVEESAGGFHSLVDAHLGGDPHLLAKVESFPALTLPPFARGPQVGALVKQVHALVGLVP